jgi:DNA helicase HerA-like ATPase
MDDSARPKNQTEPVGRASATENDPNTAEKFSFWLRPGILVNPFDIVDAEHFDGTRTYGLVTGLEHRTDASSHLANFFSNDFGLSTEDEPNSIRQGTTIAKAAVLSNDDQIYMPVQNESRVRFADSGGVHVALGITEMPEDRRIPAGLIEMSNGTKAVAYLDKAFLVGPEGAHLNISGISGLATKTSYAMFLLQSLFQKDTEIAERTGRPREYAAIILNVKHGDLLTIDQEETLSEDDANVWRELGLVPKAFDNVQYLLPPDRNYGSNHKPNSAYQPNSYDIYGYALRETADKLDLLFSNTPDANETLDSLIGEIAHGIQGNEKRWQGVQTWHDLLWKEPLFDSGKGQSVQVGEVRASSVGRFRRLMRRMVETRDTGLFVDNRPKDIVQLGDRIKGIEAGQVIVVDIAQLQDWEQTLVFGDILRTVYSLYAESDEDVPNLPKRTVIFVDELNKYAPAGGREASKSPIVEQILEVAERGRSIGIVLFSAQQFLSAVHPRVAGNAATLVLGRNGAAELSSPDYRFIDADVKMNVTRLSKGQLLLSHAIYRQPVRISFPKPAYVQKR